MELTAKLSGDHNVFHVSQLKRCLKPPTDVVIEDTIPLEPDLTYKAYPIKILDQQDRVTRHKTTRFYKIQWNEHSEDEATWEREDFLRANYHEFLPSRKPPHLPHPFYAFVQSRDEIYFKGRAVTPRVTETLKKVINK
jgi:hypothetical protein